MSDLPEPQPALAVSLSSAFLGFYTHTGFLEGMVEKGVWPSQIAGASSGALVGGLVASGMAPRDLLKRMLTLEFRTAFFEPGMIVGLPYLPIYKRRYSGAIRGDRILAYLKRQIGNVRVEECPTPMGVAVTNLSQVRTEIRTEGPLAELIVASCAYPTLISHQLVGGDALWDGGIAQSPPFIHWAEVPEVRQVIAHCIGESEVPPAVKLGVSDAFALSHDILVDELYQMRVQRMQENGKEVHKLVTPSQRPPWFITEKRGQMLFEAGLEMGRKAAQLARADTALI